MAEITREQLIEVLSTNVDPPELPRRDLSGLDLHALNHSLLAQVLC